MKDDLFTTLEVARLLGVKEWQIRYRLRAGTVRRPAHVAAGAFLWRPAEVRDLARALDVPIPSEVAGELSGEWS